ncbi:PREDICTED: putative F-box/LRR-repeat protein At5g41630 [Camelina sativa]|uniref:F-box/LRR-repeat protein At5g41630 n=1 Tax=Camelina sativa TaxID=90675 RepID=A0ABM1R959_CAMSA|nr:PREDICTED: putative F-box/LRR-repeat protein At5g41630 [Camelina sativa]XP_019095547.1 PREDICTED: putative F-box/LRR-repeat protein At5g41630 [Camelina sativa]
MAVRYQQVSFDSLVEARIGLRVTHDVRAILQGYKNVCYLSSKETSNVTNFLTGVHNVKILYLSVDILQVFCCCPDTVPVFNNLIHLTIETKRERQWKPLPAILKNCPNLVDCITYIHLDVGRRTGAYTNIVVSMREWSLVLAYHQVRSRF